MALRKPRVVPVGGPLPGYADLREIGGGAFATVYRAVESETGRAVALKVLKLDTVHAHLTETFEREIKALAKVSDHPNIVTLYRALTATDGRPVLVLELCRESLAERLRGAGTLPAHDVVRAAIKIAGALETAHRHGFLHRDMKPQNILVTHFGEPALADFGVAALQASAQATAGVFGFTTLHAAPEMLEGQHLSPATDVYGLASTMYQLLTGRAPFASFENEAPASVILRILRDPVRPPVSDSVPLALSDLLEASLSKRPEGRPGSALEFAQALRSVEVAHGWPATEFRAWGEDGDGVKLGPGLTAPAPPPASASNTSLQPAARSAMPDPPKDPPPPPMRPVAPSLAVPERSVRRVVEPVRLEPPAPEEATQVRPVVPQVIAQPRVDPVPSPTSRAADPAPTFVDPSPERGHPSGSQQDSPYERTMDVGRLFTPAPRADRPAGPDSGGSRRRSLGDLPAGAVLAGVAAGAVILVAVLLIVGLI